MTDVEAHLRLQVDHEDAAQEAPADLTARLRNELLDLGVETVVLPRRDHQHQTVEAARTVSGPSSKTTAAPARAPVVRDHKEGP